MASKKRYKTLRLILGDQLNAQHSWYQQRNEDTLYLIAELRQEATYVKHHIQKLCAFFLAMENFAAALQQADHEVLHLTIGQTTNYENLADLITSQCERHGVKALHYQRPDEYRLLEQLRRLNLPGDIAIEEYDTEHFLLPFEEIDEYITAGKHNRMEAFYRKMRKRFLILVDGTEPVGGRWNFDSDNREKLKTQDLDEIPQPLLFANPTAKVLRRIKRAELPYFGEIGEHLLWPITRTQALELLAFFCKQCLPQFGRFQDAMTGRHPHAWSLYHSRLSFALPSGEVKR